MTRPTAAALTSTLVAVVVGYHAFRRRHELRTLAWAITGRPKSQADPTSCDGEAVAEWIRLHDTAKRTGRIS